MAVVTISRQSGSKGDEIAALLAKKLNHELIDDEKIHFIVSAVGYRSNTQLVEEINDDIPATVIGDASRPGTIFEAIRDGFDAAAGLRV